MTRRLAGPEAPLAPLHPSRRTSLTNVPLIARSTIETPAGPMTALATAAGLAALVFATDRHHPGPFDDVPAEPGHPALVAAREWLDRYWQGRAPDPATVPLDLHGTPFQRSVWQVLLRIPPGQTWTYGEVATAAGPRAVPRATGQAIGRNPVAVLVPCHRVIGAGGSLTGYAGGLAIKQRLLAHECTLLI